MVLRPCLLWRLGMVLLGAVWVAVIVRVGPHALWASGCCWAFVGLLYVLASGRDGGRAVWRKACGGCLLSALGVSCETLGGRHRVFVALVLRGSVLGGLCWYWVRADCWLAGLLWGCVICAGWRLLVACCVSRETSGWFECGVVVAWDVLLIGLSYGVCYNVDYNN